MKTDASGRLAPLPVPEPDAKNPLPIVLAKDGVVVLSYMAFVRFTEVHVIVTFPVAAEHRFGARRADSPKDGAYEKEGSDWGRGGKAKHFVFAFPEAVFECLSEGYGAETVVEDEDAVRLMSRRLYK
jgi:hypothetical protein